MEFRERSLCAARVGSVGAPLTVRDATEHGLAAAPPFGDPQGVAPWAEAVRVACRPPRWRRPTVVASLPGKVVDTIPLRADARDARALDLAVARQATEHLPYPVTDAVADYLLPALPAGEEPHGGDRHVILVACRRQVVEFALDVLERAGLEPIALEIPATALARVQPALPAVADGGRLVVHVADESTTLALVGSGDVLLSRIISWGTGALVQRVADSLAMPAADAARLLGSTEVRQSLAAEEGAANGRVGRTVVSLISPLLDDLLVEVDKVWAYCASQFRPHQPRSVLVTGGGHLLALVAHHLREQLPQPVSMPEGDAAGLLGPMAVAAGLAMRGRSCLAAN